MGPRPAHLNLGDAGRVNNLARASADDDDKRPQRPPFKMDLPSPRTGDVPPALSPLDAFAFQSRALARRFEEEDQHGRRISRLPPMMVAKEISGRSDYFRSQSAASESRMSDLEETPEDTSPLSSRGKVEESRENGRPKSLYPVLGDATDPEDAPDVPAMPTSFFHAHNAVPAAQAQSYFDIGMPRASSPEPVESSKVNVEAPTPSAPSLTNSLDSVSSSHPRTWTNESQRSQRSQPSERGLAPPQSPRFPKSPRSFQSIRSIPPDSGDEDGQSVNGSHPISSARKFSGSSGMSRPQSPFSPWMHPVHRSPSMTSEYSMASSQPFPRPNTNFSRPMSSSGSQAQYDTRPSFDNRPSFDSRPSFELRPSGDIPHRQASSATSSSTQPSVFSVTPSRQASGDDAGQPCPPADDAAPVEAPVKRISKNDASNPQAASYIYAKYALPRGRNVDRESDAFRESWIQRQFKWDAADDTSRPLPPPQAPQQLLGKQSFDSTPEFLARPPSATGSDRGRIGRQLASNTSAARSHSADPRAVDKPVSFHRSSPSVKTESTDRTIRATPLHQKSASADLTAEEHLEIGIQAHSSGETNKSTYHLRLAAIAGLPTAMLLYALACRHGWGMRANPEEGVKWLRKAVDTSGLDLVDAEDRLDTASARNMADPASTASERKKRKAQYALAIYELGISSMNGWGCAKDKPLALRCYELAGSWGDADALAEAGFCYTQGVGCKKDLKKAAALYRQAADYGMSMAGNSWIYKAKYMDDVASSKKPSDKEKDKKRPETAASKESKNDEWREREREAASKDKPAGRARSRSIWGRKKEKVPPSPLPNATGPPA